MDEVMTPDARDLQAARQGGEAGAAAFTHLYDRHAGVVLALCRRHTRLGFGDDAEADDALQETFIRAFQMLDRIDDPDRIRPWLYAIARRVCAERRRAAGRRIRHEARGATVMINVAMEHTPAPGAGRNDGGAGPDQVSPGSRAEHSEQLSLLDQALDKLSDSERLAIHIYYLDPDPVVAASDTLGLSRSGFYKLLAKAKDHLAALMGKVGCPSP